MAIHYNRPITNLNRKKKVDPYVRTWFNQPGRKLRRHLARQAKAAASGGIKPIDKLRPLVRCPGQLHNWKVRLGRGFTIEEIKAAGFEHPSAARSIGIAVDLRRKNRTQCTFDNNVKRLQEYRSRLVVLPRFASKPAKGMAGIPDDALKSTIENKSLIYKLKDSAVFKPTKHTSALVE